MRDVSPSNQTPLSIAVLGVGAIGSTFAYYLSKAGHDVTVVARPASQRFQKLSRDQAIVLESGEKARVQVADVLDEVTAYDLIVVTTLDYQVDALLPSLQRCKAACVLFMFNTLKPARLEQAVGKVRCAFGVPFVMSRLSSEGRLDSKISPFRKTLHGDRRWMSLFQHAGIPSAYEAEMELWLRSHVPLCVAMESIAIKAKQRGGIASWQDGMVVARGMRSAFSIVKKLGHPFYPAAKTVLNGTPNVLIACMFCLISRNRSFRELLSTGANECRALVACLLFVAGGMDGVSTAALKSLGDVEPLAKRMPEDAIL